MKQAGIQITEVSIRPMKVESSFPGKVSVNETRLAHVGPRIAGRAVEVYANLGDFVKKGQPVAVIDSPELGEAQSQYLKARTNLQVAEKAFERAKIVLEGKVLSTGEFQRREGEYLSARTEAKAAEDRLHLLGMTEDEFSAIGKGHTINSRVAIYSPVSGTAIERHLPVGEVVEPAKPLFTIADLSNLWVIADIPENDVSKVNKGQRVSVIASSYPDKEFTGRVTYISDTVDPASRTVKVRVEVANPPSPPFDKGVHPAFVWVSEIVQGVVPLWKRGIKGDFKNMLHYNKRLKQYSQQLRNNMTDAEKELWSKIRGKQLKGYLFYRQKPLGNFIVDFYCPNGNLVIELDGGQHYSDEGKAKDNQRDNYLKGLGLRVLRFSDREVFENMRGVLEKIWNFL